MKNSTIDVSSETMCKTRKFGFMESVNRDKITAAKRLNG